MKFLMKLIAFLMVATLSFGAIANVEIDQKITRLQNQLSLLEKNNELMSSEEIQISFKEARAIYLNKNLDDNRRILANLAYSGYVGLYAQKNWSKEHGKIAFMSLKENFEISANHKIAAQAYARAVIGICKQNWAKRKLAESSIGIDLGREKDMAMDYLKMHTDATSKDLLKILQKIDL